MIGQKRAKALGAGGRLVACADIDVGRAENLAKGSGAKVFRDWRELVWLPEVDVVVISTLHDSLAAITLAAIEAGKHILVEKPAARSASELEPVMAAAGKKGVKVHVGFNHRYHRSLRKAKEIFDSGALGELMFIRARYGHGGRIGYDKEWRAKPELSDATPNAPPASPTSTCLCKKISASPNASTPSAAPKPSRAARYLCILFWLSASLHARA